MLRLLRHVRPLAVGLFALGFALSAQGGAEMFEASFIFHAWGNDISTGTPNGPTQYLSNTWSVAPLGFDCQHAEPYTPNGAPLPRYCTPEKNRNGHPATGTGTLSVAAGTPPTIMLAQSAFGVQLITDVDKNAPPYPGTTPQCCRGFLITFQPYLQSFTYATFVNAAGTFFAGGGAAAGVGYVNKTGMTGMTAGTWRIRAGKNAFGGVMGLLGKYGATGKYTITGKEGTYSGVSSWNMVKAIGRSQFATVIGYDAMGNPTAWQNPYTKTDMWYKVTHLPGSMDQTLISTITAIGTGTLWTTGQVGGFAKTGAFYTILYRTGYDNRNTAGIGNIQLLTPTLTHWLSPGFNTHTSQIGMLTIKVPEPGAVLLLAAGSGLLGLLYWVSRRT